MTTFQFALFFAALLVGYVLVHVRLVRFEGYLKEIAGLKLLNERLKGVTEVIERVRIDRVEEALSQVHDDLVALQSALARFEDTVHRDIGQLAATPAAEAPREGPTSGERIRAAIETRLLALGYGDLKLLADLTDARLDDTYEIRVECQRDRMPSKGTVIVRNGAVVDVRLQSAAQSFP
jgi:hypothetical protein